MIAEIFQEGENYFKTYQKNVLDLRAKLLGKGQAFNLVDKQLQDEAFNTLISDYISEYNLKKASIEKEIKNIEATINKINLSYSEKVKKLDSTNTINPAKIEEFKKMLEKNKTLIKDLEYRLNTFFGNLDIIKNNFDVSVKQASNLQQEISNSIKTYRDKLNLLLNSNDKELKDYIEERKKFLHDECVLFGKELNEKLDEYKETIKVELEQYLMTKKSEFDNIYDIKNYENIEAVEEKAKKVVEAKNKIEEIKKAEVDTSSKGFIRNVLWLLGILLTSLYDYIFLNKIFVDIFDVAGGDPQGLQEKLFGLISWLNILSGGILLLLVFLYTMGNKIVEKGSKIEGYFIKTVILFIISCLIVFSVVDVRLGTKGQFVFKFLQGEGIFIELILRMLMIPVLLVGDFILLKMISWENFFLGNILSKIFFSPFNLIYRTLLLFYRSFDYLTMRIIIEKKRKELIRLEDQNEEIIRQTIKPNIVLDVDFSTIFINDKALDPENSEYISTDTLSAGLPIITKGLQTSYFELTKIKDTAKNIELELNNKIAGYEHITIEAKAQEKIMIEKIKEEQKNYLTGYMDARNKLITNLKSTNELLDEAKSSLKQGIASGFKKYILSNI